MLNVMCEHADICLFFIQSNRWMDIERISIHYEPFDRDDAINQICGLCSYVLFGVALAYSSFSFLFTSINVHNTEFSFSIYFSSFFFVFMINYTSSQQILNNNNLMGALREGKADDKKKKHKTIRNRNIKLKSFFKLRPKFGSPFCCCCCFISQTKQNEIKT